MYLENFHNSKSSLLKIFKINYQYKKLKKIATLKLKQLFVWQINARKEEQTKR